ncbi:MAG TPA: hypothetical protein VFQ84_07530 [Arenimonas sp.]|uniref:hypothetical protein n=1 Tax=Arenimonas sp. TaxID=1872635 RepID=UPI002D80124A|nr:hypothetical protein [Arenimonas sp.]HEU0153178.1 hypothetical protein [Arenimonas sp.]
MIDIILALKTVLDKSAKDDLNAWLGPLPKNAAWHVISDYVFGDPNKNDVASFVLLLHHDKLDVIRGYIDNIAPSDIKSVRSPSEGMIKYLNSPVAFSFSFVLQGEPGFLKGFATSADMLAQLDEFGHMLDSFETNTPQPNEYFALARSRVRQFVQELRQKGNQKLARKVFLLAAYAVAVFEYLDLGVAPQAVSWVSDRDAMLDRHDGVVCDIATLMFWVMKSGRVDPVEGEQMRVIDRPTFIHVQPEKTGPNHMDPLIRMADYVAGTVADMSMKGFEFSHQKFREIAQACFVESKNHVIVTIAHAGDRFTVRRVGFKET